MIRWVLALGLLSLLAACAGGERGPLPVEQVQAVAYQDPGGPKLTLVTVVNNRSGGGAHTALMVSGSQRVLFDPAGSFRPDWVTEHGDVIYGMTPRFFQAYRSAHSRAAFHIVTQDIPVSPEVAEQALRLVQNRGRVGSAFCANSTSSLLRELPGFEDIKVTFFPVNLQKQIAQKPGVVTDRYFEDDEGHVLDGISDLAPASE